MVMMMIADLTSGSQVPICLPREDDRLGEPRQMLLTVYAQPLLCGSFMINITELAHMDEPGIKPRAFCTASRCANHSATAPIETDYDRYSTGSVNRYTGTVEKRIVWRQ